MADRKITEFVEMTIFAGEDLLNFIDDPDGTPVNKKASLDTFLASLPSNTNISGTFSVGANTLLSDSGELRVNTGRVILANNTTVSSNNATTQFGVTGMEGAVFWDSNYIYVAVSNTQIKRVALEVFS